MQSRTQPDSYAWAPGRRHLVADRAQAPVGVPGLQQQRSHPPKRFRPDPDRAGCRPSVRPVHTASSTGCAPPRPGRCCSRAQMSRHNCRRLGAWASSQYVPGISGTANSFYSGWRSSLHRSWQRSPSQALSSDKTEPALLRIHPARCACGCPAHSFHHGPSPSRRRR